MQIRKISKNEINVFVSDRELMGYNINADGEKMPESAELHKFLFELMDTVYVETGFDPYGGQVVVEATPLRNGMNFTISKIGRKKQMTKAEFANVKSVRVKSARIKSVDKLSDEEIYDIVDKIAGKGFKRKRKLPSKGSFLFGKYTDLEKALSVLASQSLIGCGLYRNGGRYVLITDFDSNSVEYNCLSEFSQRIIKSDAAINTVKEMWSPVAAGDELADMSEQIKNMM